MFTSQNKSGNDNQFNGVHNNFRLGNESLIHKGVRNWTFILGANKSKNNIIILLLSM